MTGTDQLEIFKKGVKVQNTFCFYIEKKNLLEQEMFDFGDFFIIIVL